MVKFEELVNIWGVKSLKEIKRKYAFAWLTGSEEGKLDAKDKKPMNAKILKDRFNFSSPGYRAYALGYIEGYNKTLGEQIPI